MNLFCERYADFSVDRAYRYRLKITWGDQSTGQRLGIVNFIMLNPSTADEIENDPTVERCERRARKWGYSGLVVTNLFALRSTDPAGLKTSPDPIGRANDDAIASVARESASVVCAWGNHGGYLGRDIDVIKMLRAVAPGKTTYLKLSKLGRPCHPLYLSYSLNPKKYDLEGVS